MDFKVIETKWQKFWEEHPELYLAKDESDKEKKYVLVEFPYPSGSGLHVGHAFSFTGGDVYARFKRMKGNNVMFPMGWDAFGLPTENYAIKTKRKPQEVTKENTDMFRSQMKRLAYSFDWSREVNTTDANYYKWTQWIFIELFKKGLAYKKEVPINWCPSCKTGLANEEVVDGKCERCGEGVERRTISQWVVKITEYADKLIDGLKETEFIEKVKQAQVNWIGKSEGARVKFKIKGRKEVLEVFTTRPDTLPGATFMVMAPEHEIALELARSKEDVREYLKIARSKSEMERTELSKEKSGVFSGLMAINPVNDKEIPIWISDFVLASYGTGAIMAVPAHDERDHAFAKKFGLPIVPVINVEGWDFEDKAMVEVEKGAEFMKMLDWVEDEGIGKRCSSYHLRDWIFSRQHYWGEPIPMINCPKCGWVPVPKTDLPVVLPEIEAYEPTDDGKSPLSKIDSFVNCKCPVCGGEAKRETDTMPNWAGSDWYFLRYIDPHNDTDIASAELMKKWMPVDVYIGGDEHNTLHLLYSRFIYLFLKDIGAVPKEISEPYFKRISHGVILGTDNQRMSKSKGNVIVPETVADKFGVDVLRLYLMFMGPFESTMAWNENTLMGVKRFLDKFNRFVIKHKKSLSDSSNKSKLIINKTIVGVDKDLENFSFNTVVAKLMEAVNEIDVISVEDLKKLVQLCAPLAPYLTEELWQSLGEDSSVHISEWPESNKEYLTEEVIQLPVAVNGKVKDKIEIEFARIAEKDYVDLLVSKSEKLKKILESNKIIREIYVPGKMLNLVVKENKG
ncbi:leucine--tRNA ligase [Patescibacteria group bacterium]|nr:leucine--tRNA ligase [Patescibacteria group bacterium]